MSKTKSKIAPPQPLKELGEEIIDYVKSEATKEEVKYFEKEIDEMIKMVEDGLKKYEK